MLKQTRTMRTKFNILKWVCLVTSPIAVLTGQSLPGSVSIGIGITAPANGATVTGSVTVSAHPVANLGVASVQFFADGVSIAPLVQTSPYAISWNTASM